MGEKLAKMTVGLVVWVGWKPQRSVKELTVFSVSFRGNASACSVSVDVEARAQPCLIIRWSAACPTVVAPVGYVVSVLDKRLSNYHIETLPTTQRSDLVYRLPVEYGDEVEIRVSSTFPGSKAVGPVTFQVPEALQPFKVKITVNQEDGAFVVYWAEPFVPPKIGRFYYQISEQ